MPETENKETPGGKPRAIPGRASPSGRAAHGVEHSQQDAARRDAAALPGTDALHESSCNCPSCGKPNPPQSLVCHFCTASINERMSLAMIKIGVVVLLGLALAHFGLALTYSPRYTPIHELVSEMNFERVRVLGRVTAISVIRGAYNSPQVRIEIEQEDTPWISPDLRTISARIEGEAAGDFLKMEKPLSKGDLIEVAASLFAGEGFRHLSVSSPQFIRVIERHRPADAMKDNTPAVTVQELLGNPEKYRDATVSIRNAEITSVVDGLPVFHISDPGRPEKDLIVFGYEGKTWSAGAKVSVRGQFAFYEKKGCWEIKIARGDLLAVAAAPENGKGN